MKKLFQILTLFVLIIGLGGAFSFFTGFGNTEKNLLIPRGVAVGKVASQLASEGVIAHPLALKLAILATGGRNRVKAGEYAFKTDMGVLNALGVLYFSAPIEHAVTVPEGWNARQISAILAQEKLVDPQKFVNLVLSKKSAEKYKLKSPTLEGFLFPDTYTFSRVDGEERILDRMVNRFFTKVDRGLIERAKHMGMSLEQLVTLASIIEKETGVSTEREIISSVFHNRLKKKMRLQSDPTTIYGISGFDGNLTRKHLLTPSPYNTYTISGLPPGAIASPGLATLQATVNPAQTNFLYFVANNQGTHLFSETYAEHAKKVDQYQKRRASRRQADSIRQLGTIRK